LIEQKATPSWPNQKAWRIWRIVAFTLLSVGVLSAETPQRPRITGIAHISLFSHDCAKTRSFYSDFLGFQEPYTLKNSDGSLSMMFFKINDRQYIEIAPELQAETDRLSHISLETDDVEALRIYLASKGVKVPNQAHRGRLGNLSFDITDPAGHRVEMTQYMPDGWTMRAAGKYMSDSRLSERMEHVGLVVTDLDPEYKFYTDILGFKETYRGGKAGAAVLSWINLTVPEGDDYIELMLFKQEPDVPQLGAQHHLDVQVPDVTASIVALKAKPYYKEYGRDIELHLAPNHKRQTNVFDPDGTRIEIMEPSTIDGKPSPTSTSPPP
jgi:catechol 2,3-dioxygenase-like lactoylglutathione lyase family enzyme